MQSSAEEVDHLSHEKANSSQDSKTSIKTNKLANENSPYLLQHATNPVDWYPWGKEAFTKAKRENKPIFLSIGYSSCHWCHVMENESFKDDEVAKFMNENFVSIKVDREERPDIDEIYMKSVVATTGSGGWPLSVFLTPSLEPFFGGTYFPPTPRYGMPSFSNVLRSIAQSWKSDRKKLVDSASAMKSSLVEMFDYKKSPNSKIDDSILDDCYNDLASSFDDQYGGFGNSPKFPTPSNLFFLTRYHLFRRSNLALTIVTKTLDSMMRGGIYDHIGGGFHRYSTDRYWQIPHFEKMLYDNALLVLAYCEGFLLARSAEYELVVEETLGWAMREMRTSEGGFYSAQDADSSEGEGSYYAWTPDEMKSALSVDENLSRNFETISNYFSMTRNGNFEGKNILAVGQTNSTAGELGGSKIIDLVVDAKKLLLEYRDKRPKPSTDDKIITSWNGLMISALSKAHQIFGKDEYLSAAKTTAEFVLAKLASSDAEGKIKLVRRYRRGESKVNAVLEDYSFLINGLLDLYESSFEPKYFDYALNLADTMVLDFYDKSFGGFFQTAKGSTDLIARAKDAYDGALPSGNSIAALVCLRLAEMTSKDEFRNLANDTILAFWDPISRQPSSFTEMLVALQFSVGKPKEIVVSGNQESAETQKLLKVIRNMFLPNSVVILADSRLEKLSPLLEHRLPIPGESPKVFVCSNFTCKLPAFTEDELEKSLAN
ncbi:MAG: thioredoxin domain-containing protein [Thaumarchaeota archaeon]|nr:thioredoxin domain-containing protein [Nitrososphaerota archaeon]